MGTGVNCHAHRQTPAAPDIHRRSRPSRLAPAFAVSLSSTINPQPIPADTRDAAAPLAIESWSTGQRDAGAAHGGRCAGHPRDAGRMSRPAATGTAVGKPVDDVTFVKRATESGRKEVAAARDALPQLKAPELKRIAEMLVQDHSSANAKLSKIAETKGWADTGAASRRHRRPRAPRAAISIRNGPRK